MRTQIVAWMLIAASTLGVTGAGATVSPEGKAAKEEIVKPPRGKPDRKPNHLAGQTSPYLLQHLHNPVDWYAWGPEALGRAKKEGRPIFLSIGYAACHWCHVMERESFESEEIAKFLNENFVAIKVDREERPDLDEIYMNAVQIMTGQGGWPLSVFLTPDGKPFFGGTYFPPDDRYGRAGFLAVLRKIHEIWTTRPAEVAQSAEQMTERLRGIGDSATGALDGEMAGRPEMARAAAEVAGRFDEEWGGFGAAPKFPPESTLALLLREHARSEEKLPLRMVETTLDRMALGGMYDQVGGGFARYSTDEKWLVPHFEKMLYNQALLVPVYMDAWLLTGKPLYRRIVEETLDFVRREMTDSRGGFHSSLDADSEGHEGRFYVWTPAEVASVLGKDDGDLFCRVYGITPDGNFEGRSIPNLLGGDLAEHAKRVGSKEEDWVRRLAPLRAKLLAAREKRVRPASDDKVLAAWNGLMITAFARASQAFGREEDLSSALRAADFALGNLMKERRLLASYRAGRAHLNAYLDDHAFLARGLVDLYESCFDRKYLDAATAIARTMVLRFEDGAAGGFFFTSSDHETLLARNKSLYDGALPAGAGVAVEALMRLAAHRNDPRLRASAERALRAYRPVVARAPSGFASLLAAADFARGPVQEIAIVGAGSDPATRALLAVVRSRFLPNRIVAMAPPGGSVADLPLLDGKALLGGRPAAYVCRNYACRAPTSDPEVLARSLGGS